MQENIITSKDNDKIKSLRKLNNKKFRKLNDKFLIENLIIIEDAQKAGNDFEEIFVTHDFIKKSRDRFESIAKNKDYFLIDHKINKSFSNLETPSGICAVYNKPQIRIDLKQTLVYLNKISDPGNLGTILRSALAFDFNNIIIDENCADLYNSKTISAARDAIFKLNIEFDENKELLKNIKNKMPIIVSSLQGDSDIDNLRKEKACFVFGNEVSGVDNEVLKLADKKVKIKMTDNIESLNVANAAAIIFYHIYNK
jgi:RNA methyltransferase, TrmH family